MWRAEAQATYQAGSRGKRKGLVDVQLSIAPAPPGGCCRPWTALFPGVVWQHESTPPLPTNSQHQLLLPTTNAQRFYRFKAPSPRRIIVTRQRGLCMPVSVFG